ncbi:hypothetical protein EDB84DRAFT_1444749 [Lactarius hengduanensis]|nr:hypothetical protein EDB84DRAFT_1444749 [Lactarius hengduanensis]
MQQAPEGSEGVEERPYRNQRLVEGEEQRTLPQSQPDSESTIAREGQPTDREGSEGVEERPYDKHRVEEEEQANPPTESTRQRDPKVLRSTNAKSKRRSKRIPPQSQPDSESMVARERQPAD